MTERKDPIQPVPRRVALKLIGIGGGIVLGTGSVVGRDHHDDPKPHPHDTHWGESVAVDGGEVRTYATTNRADELSSLGVHVDGNALEAFDEDESHFRLNFPTVDTRQFEFLGFDYTPSGHPPEEIYDVPHFDIHFYMVGEREIENISGGPLGEMPLPFLGIAAYDIPDDQFPEGYEFEQVRFIVTEMGEHLLDATAPEFHGDNFAHTYVYGAYDPSIDPENPDDTTSMPLGPEGEDVDVPVYGTGSEGEITFVEPMITTEFLREDLSEAVSVEVATPETGDYPTAYAIKPDGEGGAFVSLEGF
ncbi:hypothetical protein [Natrialba sp. INN-245]|uniref:hypothetical protein n=1 Tax=Natrialba sp. INN-245 TaxID=2690967 RepID=UPI001311ABF0|nr:hypothetical protein [Natrialba sp. INN-245]MWV40589.1 hypothetical protein [Natrialba sp. INN-245]